MTVVLMIILFCVAVLHALWGLEIWLPVRDEQQLARTVIGARGVTRMPGAIPCFLVVAGLFVIIAALWMGHTLLGRFILWGATAVFLVRGVIAYSAFWQKMTPEQPFATYDKKYYAPLCLLIGAGLVTELLRGL